LLVLGLATVFMAVASWTAVRAMSALGQARVQLATSQTELAQLRNLIPTVEQHERYALAAGQFNALVAASGLDPAKWTDRRVNHASRELSRQEAETLLQQQITAGSGQWFAADRFNVGVIAPSTGLFTAAQEGDRGFSVEMSGMVYFPLDVK
jgi:hypothetical protein